MANLIELRNALTYLVRSVVVRALYAGHYTLTLIE